MAGAANHAASRARDSMGLAMLYDPPNTARVVAFLQAKICGNGGMDSGPHKVHPLCERQPRPGW
eukprot:scaffold87074_cov42-Phaeocystis_antarctica.AAC.1